MSEDVIGKLGRFTPTAVDRDALLFAAGRASAKTPRAWKLATAALVASQLVTLSVLFWPNPAVTPTPVPAVMPVIPDALPLPPDPYSLLALSRDPDPESAAVPADGPPRPPLAAFSRTFQP